MASASGRSWDIMTKTDKADGIAVGFLFVSIYSERVPLE
jgi:hypothetical protein